MLVQFTIEYAAINASVTPAQVARLLSQWARFGVLVFPPHSDSRLIQAIESLPPTQRKIWKKTWQLIVHNNGNAFRRKTNPTLKIDWEKIRDRPALASLDVHADVAVLGETRANLLGIPDGESRICGNIEGLRLWDIDASESFSRANQLANDPIRVGDSIRDVWEERFQSVACHSKTVVVVDAYAARRNNINGILRLLAFLDRDANNCPVTLYSSMDPNSPNLQQIRSRIGSAVANFSGGGIAWLQLLLYRDSDFKMYSHDRHLRFDNSVFRIGRGLRVFERSNASEASDVALVTLEPGAREQKESDLDSFGVLASRIRMLTNK
ncbi:MAG: hypothetical protein OXG77_02320 [Chloroflexi bacterium]|nr:hypothetical protein [Chloroflexota bacterium]